MGEISWRGVMEKRNPVLSEAEMEQEYGAFYSKRPRLRLNKAAIPQQFWPLIPYAEFWGIADDWAREEFVAEAPSHARQNLKDVVGLFDNALDEWLAGPDAASSNPSDEYVAFSAMRLAGL